MLSALIPVLAPILGKVAANLFPDPAEQARAEAEMMRRSAEKTFPQIAQALKK